MALKSLLQATGLAVGMTALTVSAAMAMITGNDAPTAASTSSGTGESGVLYAQAQASIAAGDYAGAIDPLQRIVTAEPGNADAYNLLGYASRSLEQYNDAMEYYRRALEADPEHLGANEYYGELMLTLGNLAGAEERLAVLDEVCYLGCDEYDALASAIDDYKTAE